MLKGGWNESKYRTTPAEPRPPAAHPGRPPVGWREGGWRVDDEPGEPGGGAPKRSPEARHAAATRASPSVDDAIQALVRWREDNAVAVIAAAARMRIRRLAFLETKRGAVVAQSLWRRRSARRRCAALRSAAAHRALHCGRASRAKSAAAAELPGEERMYSRDLRGRIFRGSRRKGNGAKARPAGGVSKKAAFARSASAPASSENAPGAAVAARRGSLDSPQAWGKSKLEEARVPFGVLNVAAKCG